MKIKNLFVISVVLISYIFFLDNAYALTDLSAGLLGKGEICGTISPYSSGAQCNTTLSLSCVCGSGSTVPNYCTCEKTSTKTMDGIACGASGAGICEVGSLMCPDGKKHLFGGSDCASGLVCCVTDTTVAASTLSPAGSSKSGSSSAPSDATSVARNQYDSPGLTQADFDLIAGQTGLPAPVGGVKGILTNLLTWMLEVVGVIALIGFVVSGTQYILSSADEKLAETAKKNMTYSITGMVVVLASFIIIKAINVILNTGRGV